MVTPKRIGPERKSICHAVNVAPIPRAVMRTVCGLFLQPPDSGFGPRWLVTMFLADALKQAGQPFGVCRRAILRDAFLHERRLHWSDQENVPVWQRRHRRDARAPHPGRVSPPL
eukprot:scaffold190155_cov24-Prasinocladus_malaysianus.AAC.1